MVVLMKKSSGLRGYGNYQCIEWISQELGEISLYGHNENYKTYDIDRVISYPDKQPITDYGCFDDFTVDKLCALSIVSQRSELLRVFDSFYDWHKKQGYVSVKRYDFEEYLKTLNCG